MDSGLPGFSVHRIFQARILEWVAFPLPGDIPPPAPRDRTAFPALAGRFLTTEPLSLSLFITLMVIKTTPKKKRCKKAKWLSEEALEIPEKRREAKDKGEKERYIHLNAEFQRIARRDKKAFHSDQCKEIEGSIEWETQEISLRKLEIPWELFMQRWA